MLGQSGKIAVSIKAKYDAVETDIAINHDVIDICDLNVQINND